MDGAGFDPRRGFFVITGCPPNLYIFVSSIYFNEHKFEVINDVEQ